MLAKFLKSLISLFGESLNREEEVKSICLDKADALLASTLLGLKS